LGSREASAKRGPLLWVLVYTARPDSPTGEWPAVRGGYETGAVITAIVVAVAGGIGFAVARQPARQAVPYFAPDPDSRALFLVTGSLSTVLAILFAITGFWLWAFTFVLLASSQFLTAWRYADRPDSAEPIATPDTGREQVN
jgi:hypothetical protein